MNADLAFYSNFSDMFSLPIPGVDYPHPFYDINKYYRVKNTQELFSLCDYMYENNPVINAVISKMTEYPITDIRISASKNVPFTDRDIDDKLRPFLLQLGYDYYTYGNAFGFVKLDFKNFIVCSNCGKRTAIDSLKGYKDSDSLKVEQGKYIYKCETCGNIVKSNKIISETVPFRNLKTLLLTRISPRSMHIDFNPTSGKTRYRYELPKTLRLKIKSGDLFTLATTPALFIEAALKDRFVNIYNNTNGFFHFKRESISSDLQAWGRPLVMAVLKAAYHYTILQRAQFTIASQMIIPMNILYARNLDGKLSNTVSFNEIYRRIKNEIAKWKRSQAYLPFFPIPVDQITIGGQGKSLFLAPELESIAKTIMLGMHVPPEFITGGLQWSATSITIRMLENQFARFRTLLQNVLNNIANIIKYQILAWGENDKFSLRLEPLRMGDDMQRKQLMINLASNNVISKKTLLQELGLDIDFKRERELISEERELDIHDQIQASVEQMKAQTATQQMSTESSFMPGIKYPFPLLQDPNQQPEVGTGDETSDAQQELIKFLQMPRGKQQQFITQFQQTFPPLAEFLLQLLQKGQFDGNDVMEFLQLTKAYAQFSQSNAQTTTSTPDTQDTPSSTMSSVNINTSKPEGVANPYAYTGVPKKEENLG